MKGRTSRGFTRGVCASRQRVFRNQGNGVGAGDGIGIVPEILGAGIAIAKRPVVSGIAEYFEPEAIIGRQVSILVNLAPRDIKGITSQGMILMAEDADGSLTFVQPGKSVKLGSEVK